MSHSDPTFSDWLGLKVHTVILCTELILSCQCCSRFINVFLSPYSLNTESVAYMWYVICDLYDALSEGKCRCRISLWSGWKASHIWCSSIFKKTNGTDLGVDVQKGFPDSTMKFWVNRLAVFFKWRETCLNCSLL